MPSKGTLSHPEKETSPETETDERNTSLADVILESDAEIDLFKEIKGRYHEDSMYRPIMEKPKEFRNFEIENELIYLKDNGRKLLCIPKILVKDRNLREIIISEAHSLLAHLGAHKTLHYLRDHVWWKDIVSDTKSYCETCVTCKLSKPSNHKPYGLLNPLAVPTEPWESIGMDFVGPLPTSSNRDGTFDSITVVICLLTAMVELLPSRIDYNATELAELMFEGVYKHHGLPKNIVSDRDVLFTSIFWKHLHELIGTKLKMSSAYHPQTDGSTERANRTVTQLLRQCINPNQKDWVSKLPAIQFAINSARSQSTGYAPFFLNNGRMPRAMVWNTADPSEYSNVRVFAQKRKLAIMSAHDSIIAARVNQTRNANRLRQIVPFKEGDFIYLSTKNISFAKGLARKLIPKYIGPYKILKDFDNQSFRIELPPHLKQRGVHDIFHSSLLRIHVPNDDRLFPGRMDTQISEGPDNDDEWAVDKVLSHAGSADNAVFEILWKSGDITWLPGYQITHLHAFDTYLDLLGVKGLSQLPAGKGKPPQDDAQVFLGAVSQYGSPSFPPSTSPAIVTSSWTPNEAVITDDEILRHDIIPTSSLFFFDLSYLNFLDLKSLFILLYLLAFYFAMPNLPGIDRPRFTRINKTQYCVLNPDSSSQWYVHVGQIMNYLALDLHLRTNGTIAGFHGMPFGYQDFTTAFNTGKYPHDKRMISTILTSSVREDEVIPSTCPVLLEHFYIIPEQCGLSGAKRNTMSDAQAYVFEEYATMQAMRNKRRKEAYRDREDKRHNAFGRFGQSQSHHNNLFDSTADHDEDLALFARTTAKKHSSSSTTAAPNITTPTAPGVESSAAASGPSVRLPRGKGKSNNDQMIE